MHDTGAVITDILSYLPVEAISGLIYVNAVAGNNLATSGAGPFMRPEFLTADLGLGLTSTDANVNCNARVAFVDACFNTPGPDQRKKWKWIGMGCMQTPSIALLSGTRVNDDTKLVEAARNGLPTLYLYGDADKIYDTVAIEGLFKERFTALDAHKIVGGSHSPMGDEGVTEMAEAIAKFARKVSTPQ